MKELRQSEITAMQNPPSVRSLNWADRYRMEMVFKPCQSERRFSFSELNRLRANIQVGISALQVLGEIFEKTRASHDP